MRLRTSAGDESVRGNRRSRERFVSPGNLQLHEHEEITSAQIVVSAAGARHSQERETSAGAGVDAESALESSA